jgi:hypothetical protein
LLGDDGSGLFLKQQKVQNPQRSQTRVKFGSTLWRTTQREPTGMSFNFKEEKTSQKEKSGYG